MLQSKGGCADPNDTDLPGGFAAPPLLPGLQAPPAARVAKQGAEAWPLSPLLLVVAVVLLLLQRAG